MKIRLLCIKIGGGIIGVVDGILSDAGDLLSDVLSDASDLVSDVLSDVSDLVSDVGSVVSDVGDGVVGVVDEVLSDASDLVSDVGSILSDVESELSDIGDGVVLKCRIVCRKVYVHAFAFLLAKCILCCLFNALTVLLSNKGIIHSASHERWIDSNSLSPSPSDIVCYEARRPVVDYLRGVMDEL